MGGKLKMAGAHGAPEAQERKTVVSCFPPNEHGHVTFPPAAEQQLKMSLQDPHTHTEPAIRPCATVFKYINRRFNLTAVALIYHSMLHIKVNYLRNWVGLKFVVEVYIPRGDSSS